VTSGTAKNHYKNTRNAVMHYLWIQSLKLQKDICIHIMQENAVQIIWWHSMQCISMMETQKKVI